MPLFFGAIGIVLIICAINNTLSNGNDGLVDLIRSDFTGPNNFLVWVIAILVAGAFGYIPKFKPVSYAFLALIFIVIVLANQKRDGSGGVFANLFSAFTNPIVGAPASAQSNANSGNGGSNVSASDIQAAAQIAAMFA